MYHVVSCVSKMTSQRRVVSGVCNMTSQIVLAHTSVRLAGWLGYEQGRSGLRGFCAVRRTASYSAFCLCFGNTLPDPTFSHRSKTQPVNSCPCLQRNLPEGVFTLGDAWSFSGLTSKIPPLGSMLNFDADVKNVRASPMCKPPDTHRALRPPSSPIPLVSLRLRKETRRCFEANSF